MKLRARVASAALAATAGSLLCLVVATPASAEPAPPAVDRPDVFAGIWRSGFGGTYHPEQTGPGAYEIELGCPGEYRARITGRGRHFEGDWPFGENCVVQSIGRVVIDVGADRTTASVTWFSPRTDQRCPGCEISVDTWTRVSFDPAVSAVTGGVRWREFLAAAVFGTVLATLISFGLSVAPLVRPTGRPVDDATRAAGARPAGPPARRRPGDEVARLLWGTIPARSRRLGGGITTTLTGGDYLAAIPYGWAAPPGLALGGFLGGVLTTQNAGWWLVVPAALAGAAGLGPWFAAGLVVGTVAHGVVPVAALVVALLAIVVPALARALALGLPLGPRPLARHGVEVAAAAVLTLQWCWSAPVLMRPAWVWFGQAPEVFTQPWVLVPIVVVVSVARIGAEQWLAGTTALERVRQLSAQAPPVAPLPARLPAWARLALRILLTVAIVGGLASTFPQAVLGAVVVAGVTWLAAWDAPIPHTVRAAVDRVPVLARLLVALLAPLLLFAIPAGAVVGDETGVLPYLAVIMLVAATLLLLARPAEPSPRQSPPPFYG